MSIRERLRNVSLTPRGYPPAKPLPETAEYVDARQEARDLCRNLGLDVDNPHWDQAAVGDFLRLAYAEGWKACESRINSPDMADALAVAVSTPGAVVERTPKHQCMTGHIVKAVQRVVVYGVPKDTADKRFGGAA